MIFKQTRYAKQLEPPKNSHVIYLQICTLIAQDSRKQKKRDFEIRNSNAFSLADSQCVPASGLAIGVNDCARRD